MSSEWVPFSYYVFASAGEEPNEAERKAGVYLRSRASATHLDPVLGPMGISTSDDCTLGGPDVALLRDALASALTEVVSRKPSWPVVLGRRADPDTFALGEPIVEQASKQELLDFLQSALAIAGRALESRGYVTFGGGE